MRRTLLRSQWIQVGGYNPGMSAYQEGGFWNTLEGPALSYVGNLAAKVGHETAGQVARQFYKRSLSRGGGITAQEKEKDTTRQQVQDTKRSRRRRRQVRW